MTTTAGLRRLLSLGIIGSGANAEFGAVSENPFVVNQAAPAPLQEVVQPAGKAGSADSVKVLRKQGRTAEAAEQKRESNGTNIPGAILQLERGDCGATATAGHGKGKWSGDTATAGRKHSVIHWPARRHDTAGGLK